MHNRAAIAAIAPRSLPSLRDRGHRGAIAARSLINFYKGCIWFNLLPVYPFLKDIFGSKQRQGVGEGYIKRDMYLFPNLLRETGQLTSLLYEIKYNIMHFVKHQNYNMYRIITNDFRTEAIFFFHR